MSAHSATAHEIVRVEQAELEVVCAKHDRLWSARPGGARAVFAWKDLSGLDLRGKNLCDADLTGAILAGCDMRGVRLDHANLFGADLQNANLTDASMRRADLRGVCLRNANLTNADLFEADLREGAIAAVDRQKGLRVLEHVNRVGEATGAILAGANLERSRLSGVMAIRADFTDAVLKDAKMIRANFKQANMAGANLAGADMSGADFAGANMRDCILVGAKTFAWNISQADMRGVLTDNPAGQSLSDLPYKAMIRDHARWCETGGAEGSPSVFDGADLRALETIRGYDLTALSAKGAVFYGLDMEGVQLQGAQLEGADLRACNLRRADLRGARLVGAKLAGADLRDAQMGPLLLGGDRVLPCNLTGASLKNADLARADLRHAVMTDADLSRANFTNAMLRNANFTGAQKWDTRGLDETI